MTHLEVLDSALKIGLGAFISGITTYFITKTNHSNEKNKELRIHKIKTIELIAENYEIIVRSINNFFNKIEWILKFRQTDEEYQISSEHLTQLKKFDDEIIAAFESASTIKSRLSLIKAKDASKEISCLMETIAQLRNPMMTEGRAPTQKNYLKLKSQVKKISTAFNSELSKIYNNIE